MDVLLPKYTDKLAQRFAEPPDLLQAPLVDLSSRDPDHRSVVLTPLDPST
jgi:hypothetical protein